MNMAEKNQAQRRMIPRDFSHGKSEVNIHYISIFTAPMELKNTNFLMTLGRYSTETSATNQMLVYADKHGSFQWAPNLTYRMLREFLLRMVEWEKKWGKLPGIEGEEVNPETLEPEQINFQIECLRLFEKLKK